MRLPMILGEEFRVDFIMQDRPSNAELSQAVREFLELELLPEVTDARLKFRVLVAMNALGMISREADLEESNLQAEFSSLKNLLEVDAATPDSFSSLKALTQELNAELAKQIRAGQVPKGLFEHLERVTKAKLSISNPAYLRRYE
jgi:predicted membrane GTPase involved in stress response